MTDHRNVIEEREKKTVWEIRVSSFHLRLLLSSFLPLRDPLVLPETNVKVKKISFRRQELHERERERETYPTAIVECDEAFSDAVGDSEKAEALKIELLLQLLLARL